jgi:hypothetical protein
VVSKHATQAGPQLTLAAKTTNRGGELMNTGSSANPSWSVEAPQDSSGRGRRSCDHGASFSGSAPRLGPRNAPDIDHRRSHLARSHKEIYKSALSVNRFLRLLLAVCCLFGPWLAAAPAGVFPTGQNSPAEERETPHEELEEFGFGATKRSSFRRTYEASRRCDSPHVWSSSLVARAEAVPKLAGTPHKPAAKILLRRRLPTGEDPLS